MFLNEESKEEEQEDIDTAIKEAINKDVKIE